MQQVLLHPNLQENVIFSNLSTSPNGSARTLFSKKGRQHTNPKNGIHSQIKIMCQEGAVNFRPLALWCGDRLSDVLDYGREQYGNNLGRKPSQIIRNDPK